MADITAGADTVEEEEEEEEEDEEEEGEEDEEDELDLEYDYELADDGDVYSLRTGTAHQRMGMLCTCNSVLHLNELISF